MCAPYEPDKDKTVSISIRQDELTVSLPEMDAGIVGTQSSRSSPYAEAGYLQLDDRRVSPPRIEHDQILSGHREKMR